MNRTWIAGAVVAALSAGLAAEPIADEAQGRYEAIVRKERELPRAENLQAFCSQMEELIAEWEAFLRDFPKSEKAPEARMALFRICGRVDDSPVDTELEKRMHGKMLSACDDFLRDSPGHSRAGVMRLRRGIVLLKVGREKEAVEALEAVSAEGEEVSARFQALRSLAFHWKQKEERAKAAGCFRKLRDMIRAKEINPQDPRLLGHIEDELKSLEQAPEKTR